MLRPADIDRNRASFLIINNPQEMARCKVDALNSIDFIVRTRTDEFNKTTENRRETAISSGVQMISTDYPPRDNLAPDAYSVTFGNGKTANGVK